MRQKKILSCILIAAMLVGLLAGCGAGKAVPAEPTPVQTQTPSTEAPKLSKNETDEICIGVSRDSVQGSEDVFYCWEGTYVWEALTINRGGNIEPWLAESWEHNDDCTEWTFHLRKNVFFSDGEPFNADAVLANIARWGKEISSTYTTLSIKKSFPNVDEMIKVDDSTLKFTFTTPITTLEYLLADYGSPMFSPKCFDAETGKISDYAIGTGPYVLKDHVESQYVTLERNDNYWGTPGKVKNFKLVCIKSAETRYSALVSGEVQGLADNGAITMDAAYHLCQSNSDFAMDSTPSHMSEYIIFNYSNPYLQDIRMRKALNMSVDRSLICDTLYSGLAVPGFSFLSNQSRFHLDIDGDYDPEEAKKLASEVLNGTTTEMTMLIRSSKADEYNLKPVAEYMKAVWEELGVILNIEILDASVYNQRQKDNDYDMTLSVSGLNNADPTSTFKAWFATDGSSNNTYCSGYSNPEIDKLLAKAPSVSDPAQREQLHNEIQLALYEDSACLPVCYHINVNIHNVAIDGYAGQTIGVNLPGIYWVE